jgi:IS4 transposase
MEAASADVVAEYMDFSGDLRQDGAEAVDLAMQFSHHGGARSKGLITKMLGTKTLLMERRLQQNRWRRTLPALQQALG